MATRNAGVPKGDARDGLTGAGPMDAAEFGRYQLLSLIGEGGMGKVYKAHDSQMDRDVAIKVLPRDLASQTGYEQRFRREALSAGRLTEPHIIPVHEAGEIDGQLYLVMPVIDGVDLHTLLQRDGPLTPQLSVAVIEQLAAALDAAHAVGLVHRDVKPSNALVNGDGFVYLIDFGIAHDATATKLTRTGAVVGTLAYMSPERLNSGEADARSDVYALACVLYECLTGSQPFPGNSAEQQLVGHLTLDPPQPTSVDAAIPAGFDDVVARGMAKDPEQRYPSAKELAVAARRALTDSPFPAAAATVLAKGAVAQVVPPSAQGASPRRTNRKWLIASAVAALVVVLGGILVFRNVFASSAPTELVLTAATDPGANPFMAPAAPLPPTNTVAPPTLQPHGGGAVVTQPLPGNREGLYGGTLNNAECDRDKMVSFLSAHPAQAKAFVDALNGDSTLYWTGGRPLSVADIPTYLGELTPTLLRLDTRVTNHGFDGTNPTSLQSVFQPGTAVFVDAHGVPRARCFCGNPLTAPTALTGDPKPVGTPWPGYNPEALAAVDPSDATITTFVLVDVVTGLPFNRPAGSTGGEDTPHDQPIAPPAPASTAPTTGQDPFGDIDGEYLWHWVNWCAYGPDQPFTVTHQGNALTFAKTGTAFYTGTLTSDGSFTVSNAQGGATAGGVFATEAGGTFIHDGTMEVSGCSGTWTAVKQ